MSDPESNGRTSTSTGSPAVPLIPVLRPGETVGDPGVLATWYDALGNALGVELQHDLLALWLYPPGGDAQLVGPEGLAEDHLDVPLPRPRITVEQTEALAAAVRRAYPSVICVPVTFGSADVGLLLVGSLAPSAFEGGAREVVARVAEGIAPTLGRVAFHWSPPAPSRPDAASALLDEGLAAIITNGWTDARSPKDFTDLVSRALNRVLPHDHLELLIPGPAPGQQYRLGGHAGGPPWADPALVLPRDVLDLASWTAGDAPLLIPDTDREPRWRGQIMADAAPERGAIRSVLGVRVHSSGRLVAHLLIGSRGAGLYQAEDVATLTELARLIAPKVESYVLTSQLAALRRQLGIARSAPAHLARVADMLATTPHFSDATRRLAEETREMIPCDRVRIAVRLSEADRAVMVGPGETKHLADLPSLPVGGTLLGQVLRGEVADAMEETPEASTLMVPLRAAGRISGALVVSARGFGSLTRSDVAQVQQLADVAAPYLELMRRAATVPAPFIPGWKRVV